MRLSQIHARTRAIVLAFLVALAMSLTAGPADAGCNPKKDACTTTTSTSSSPGWE